MAERVFLRAELARARLKAVGLTQTSLAVLCELDVRTVQRWFAGRPVAFSQAERLASVLRIGTADLFENVAEDSDASSLTTVLSFVSRLPFLRERGAALFVRKARAEFKEFLAPLSLRRHPLRGIVTPIALPASTRHGFLALRLSVRAGVSKVTLLLRLAPSVLVERAQIEVLEHEVRLVETHFVRAIRAPRRAPDGSFDLWYWTGTESSELLIVSTCELEVEVRDLQGPLATRFDMSRPETQHAVCVRPTLTQLMRADLPRGFDRVASRDPLRIDVDEEERTG